MKQLIFVDYEEIDKHIIDRIKWLHRGNDILLAIKDEAILKTTIPFEFLRVPSKRNYSIFKKEIDSIVQASLSGLTIETFSGLMPLTEIMKFELLFALDEKLYPVWIIQFLSKQVKYKEATYVFSYSSVEEYWRLRAIGKSLQDRRINIILERRIPLIAMLKGWFKARFFSLKKIFIRFIHILRKQKEIDLDQFEIFCLEAYRNSLKLSLKSLSFKKEEGKMLYVLIGEDLFGEMKDGLPYVSLDYYKSKSRRRSVILFNLQKKNYKKAISRYLCSSDIFTLFQYKTILEIFFKDFSKLTVEAINLSLAYDKLFGVGGFNRTMVTTNFVNLFSRLFCLQYPESSTIYLQHGLIPLHDYLFKFPHKLSFLWGKKYMDFAIRNNPEKTKFLLTGDPGNNCISKDEPVIDTFDEIDFLYFASRPGGSNVSNSLHYHILKIIVSLAIEYPKLKILIKLHPTDKQDYSKYQFNNLKVVKGQNARELMKKASVIAFTSSTTGLESISSQAALIWLNPLYPIFADLIDYVQYEIPVIKNFEELKEIFSPRSKYFAKQSDKGKIKNDYYVDFNLTTFSIGINESIIH